MVRVRVKHRIRVRIKLRRCSGHSGTEVEW